MQHSTGVPRLSKKPDHVAITIHSYRWRQGLAQGEAKYDQFEKRLASAPPITVPTIAMESDANGAPHPQPAAYAAKLTGKYELRNITGDIGQNLPQEAPQALAQAVIDVDGSGQIFVSGVFPPNAWLNPSR